MYTAIMAMTWLYLYPDTAALFVRRALQAALDKEPKADVIHTEVEVLLFETPQAQPTVLAVVDIPETETAEALLAVLRRPSGTFTRTKTPAGENRVTGFLDGEACLNILLQEDGLLHVVVEPRAVFFM